MEGPSSRLNGGIILSFMASVAAIIIAAQSALYSFETEKDASLIVLCYHTFEIKNNRYSFSLKELENHIRTLLDRGYHFITTADFIHGTYSGDKNVLMTIDDGHKSVYNAYCTVLKKYDIQPLLAVYPAVTGRKKYALTWEELRTLVRQGCGIASHGYYHLYVDERLYKRDKDAFYREIAASKALLEKKLEREVDIFIFPYGVFSDITLHSLKNAGYRYAFTVEKGVLGAGDVSTEALSLPRYMVTRDNNDVFSQIQADLAGLSRKSISNAAQAGIARDWNLHSDSEPDREISFIDIIKRNVLEASVSAVKENSKAGTLPGDSLRVIHVGGSHAELFGTVPSMSTIYTESSDRGSLTFTKLMKCFKKMVFRFAGYVNKEYTGIINRCRRKTTQLFKDIGSVFNLDTVKERIKGIGEKIGAFFGS